MSENGLNKLIFALPLNGARAIQRDLNPLPLLDHVYAVGKQFSRDLSDFA